MFDCLRILLVIAQLSGSTAPQSKTPAIIPPLPDSLQWLVLDSPAVVRATMSCEKSGPVTLLITESIKGPLPKGATVTVEEASFLRGLPDRDVLLFLLTSQVQGQFPNLNMQFPAWRYTVPLDGTQQIMLMDFRILSQADQILAAARTAAAFSSAGPPRQLQLRKTYSSLVVPADSRLEELGGRWAQETDFENRILAIQALAPFKSKRNIAVVASLLRDTRSSRPVSEGKWKSGFYNVRAAADTQLREWGAVLSLLPMTGPILEYSPTEISTPLLIAVPSAILVCLMSAYIISRRSRRFSGAFSLTVALLSAALAAGATWLWIRSGKTVDELMFWSGSSHHEIASYAGGLQYVRLHDWRYKTATVAGHFDRSITEDLWALEPMTPTTTKKALGFIVARGSTPTPGPITLPFTFLRVPYWALIAPLALVCARAMFKFIRPILRRRRGQCGHCGYDLRANPTGPCPECGTIRAKPRQTRSIESPRHQPAATEV